MQQMVESDKGFLLTSKVCPQGVFCPCIGAIYMYKIMKNVYKVRFRRDHFETCNIWAKRKGLSVVIKILSLMDCLPLPGAIYIWWNMKKIYKKSDFKAIFLNLQQMGSSVWYPPDIKSFSPKGLSALALGLYTYIKSFKMCIKSDFFL